MCGHHGDLYQHSPSEILTYKIRAGRCYGKTECKQVDYPGGSARRAWCRGAGLKVLLVGKVTPCRFSHSRPWPCPPLLSCRAFLDGVVPHVLVSLLPLSRQPYCVFALYRCLGASCGSLEGRTMNSVAFVKEGSQLIFETAPTCG